jgi:hypothetical protein
VTLAVRRYEPADQPAWDEFAARSRSAHFLFRRGYMDYHADRFEDHSLLVFDGTRLLAALPANLDGSTLVSHGGLTFGGFLTDRTMSARRMLETFAVAGDYLRGRGVESWVYKVVPHIYHRVPAEEDLYALFRSGATLTARHVSSAIRLDERLPYTKGRKAALRDAERSGVVVGASQDFHAFMALQREVLQSRYGVDPVHTGAELELLASRFPEEITLRTATRDGRLLAGIVLYETPLVAHAQYIAVGDEGREAHAFDLIVDALIPEYEGRKRWLDFGGSTERSGHHLNEPLVRNKESYGARTVVYDHYLLDLAA